MLVDEIKNLHLEGEILNDPASLDAFSHDASLFEVRPELIVAPKNVEDIKKIVTYTSAAKDHEPEISITARSAGTDMTGGPLNSSIILEFLPHFNNFIEIGTDPQTGDSYAVAEPGMFYRDFEK